MTDAIILTVGLCFLVALIWYFHGYEYDGYCLRKKKEKEDE